MASFRSQFIRTLNGIPTEVLTLGNGISERPSKLILIIPGNPGPASYYKDFMIGLQKNLKEECREIWAISHVGHVIPKENHLSQLMPSNYSAGEEFLNLQGQINQKIQFIDEYVPKECDLTLVGHSIGCKISLEIMRHFQSTQPNRRPIKSYMLFPTIERMRETPSGRKAWIHIAYLVWFWKLIATILYYCFPKTILQKVISWRLEANAAECIAPTTADLVHPASIENFLSMAHDELLKVRELDVEALDEVKDHIRFYFGTIDGWCPLSYYKDMMDKFDGKLNAEVCSKEHDHAFVICGSYEMADTVSKWYIDDHHDG